MSSTELPQWISYLAGAIGLIISAVAIRLGWIKGGGEQPSATEQGRLVGALVDSSSVRDLTIAIKAHSETMVAVAEETHREMRNLGDEIRRLANKVER